MCVCVDEKYAGVVMKGYECMKTHFMLSQGVNGFADERVDGFLAFVKDLRCYVNADECMDDHFVFDKAEKLLSQRCVRDDAFGGLFFVHSFCHHLVGVLCSIAHFIG